ncbi:MAG: hypothetical protein HP024_02175, partial [Acholeplasmatales bacterium]|nr:hypothetical protein [Acholeplasmatales bacterium]
GAGVGLASCGSEEASTSASKITLNFGGSTSVEKIAKALTSSFAAECNRFEAVHNHTGSGDAFKRTQGTEKGGANKLDIGFLSRKLKSDSEAAAANTSGLICKDGIVAVVNNANSIIGLSTEQLKNIYSNQTTTWQTYGSSLEGNVTRYTRDTTSGTRDGFFTTINYKDAITDDTKLPGATIVSSNGDMIAKVKADNNGIGYISLASLSNSGLKGLSYNGIAPSEAAVVDGTYTLQRNFNYITRTQSDCSEDEWNMIQCFLAYTESREGLAIIKSKDGILTKSINDAKSWSEIRDANPTYKALCQK